jgi:hypothetical protein
MHGQLGAETAGNSKCIIYSAGDEIKHTCGYYNHWSAFEASNECSLIKLLLCWTAVEPNLSTNLHVFVLDNEDNTCFDCVVY